MERYQEELRARNAVDFDDIILLTARLFRERPDVLARWRERFHHVLVDEYQDTNASQDEILSLLCGEHRNLCVVGDDDQSIYGWRGAEIEHILTFRQRFPDAEVVRLEQNYRSTGRIVAVANAVIAKNEKRHAKTVFTEAGPGDPVRVLDLPDEIEEADFIAGEIAASLPPGDSPWRAASRFAVLFRTNEQARPLEQALRQGKVPYRLLGGRSFFDRKEVLDIVAYLRLAANPMDEEAFFRIVNVPSRGMGAGALEAMNGVARMSGASPWIVAQRVARDGSAAVPGLAAKAVAGAKELSDAIDFVTLAADQRSRTLVSDVLVHIRYQDEIDRTYKDQNVRASRSALAQEVQRTWEAYLGDAGKPSLSGFLDAITLRSNDDDDSDGSGVTLATIHASKGLEFPIVFVGGLEEGILPHVRTRDDGKALAEERRLFYVAVTRAREKLYLTRAASRTSRGRSTPTVPSRFLEDLPEDVLERGLSNAPAGAARVASSLAKVRAMLGSE